MVEKFLKSMPTPARAPYRISIKLKAKRGIFSLKQLKKRFNLTFLESIFYDFEMKIGVCGVDGGRKEG